MIKKAKAKSRKKSAVSAESGSSPDAVSSASTTLQQTTTTKPRGSHASVAVLDSQSEGLVGASVSNDHVLPPANPGSWSSTPAASLTYNLNLSCMERGTAYFFSRYVTIDENACHQRFDFVHDIWKPISLLPEKQVDGVLASMTAVGLVGMANMTKSRATLESARKSYVTALRLTNNALRNPVEAVKDTTMLSVLILGLFEMMTEASPRTMKAWQEHISGAAALAKLRGMSQFRTKAGIRMFMMLCQNTMISCIQKELPMPQPLVDLRNDLAKMFQSKEPGIEISNPIYKVLKLRYDIKQGHVTELEDMIDKLKDVEDEFEHVISTFPESWQFRAYRITRRHPAVFNGICHIYPSMWVATVWNGLRTCRMLILETIVSELDRHARTHSPDIISDRFEDEYQQARSKLERLSHAITASVPQHFGLLNPLDDYADSLVPITAAEEQEAASRLEEGSPRFLRDDSPGSDDQATSHTGPNLIDPTQTKTPEEEAERFMLLASATNTIVWPLYTIGMSSVCSSKMRQYAIDRLQAIHKETGLIQAKIVAGIVATHPSAADPQVLPLRLHDEGWQWSSESIKQEHESLTVLM